MIQLKHARLATLSAAAALALAVCLAPQGQAHSVFEDQIRAISREIIAHPEDASLFLRRGVCYQNARRWRYALSDFDRAAALAPEDSGILLARVALLMDMGLPGEAIQVLDRNRARLENTPVYWKHQAAVLTALSRPEEAEAAFGTYLKASTYPRPRDFLEQTDLILAARPHAEIEGLAVLETGLSRLGSVPALEERALELELASGAYHAALNRIERLTAAHRQPARFLARAGDLLRAAGLELEAQVSYTQALAMLEAPGGHRRKTRSHQELREQLERSLETVSTAKKGIPE